VHRFFLVFGIFLILSCGQRRKFPISEASVDKRYYEVALQEINDQINTAPSHLKLRYKRLFINSELNWVEKADDDLLKIIKEDGLSKEVYDFGTSYYSVAKHYQSLLNLVIQWEELTKKIDYQYKILALNGLGEYSEAKSLLWDYLNENSQTTHAIKFAAEYYLSWKDTTLAIYSMNQLFELGSDFDFLIENYIPILSAKGEFQRALKVLENVNWDSMSLSQNINAGQVYYGRGEINKPHRLLNKFDDYHAYKVRSDWYASMNQLDSAIIMTDKMLEKDSTQEALLRKAKYNWDQGLLFGALEVYQQVLKRDSTNSIALESSKILNRKIAYLRSLREKEKSIPFLELTTKKETENE
jgi:tetratricopeptide (TPR) repeat protein